LRPIRHEDRLSVVDHLDELRTRLIFSGITLFVVFCLCFWQNHALIKLLGRALPSDANSALTNTDTQNKVEVALFAALGKDEKQVCGGLAVSKGVAVQVSSGTCALARTATKAARELPDIIASEKSKPLTIGVGESFTATITVAAYFALLISLPIILYQLYAFIIPALAPKERRIALPAMLAAPVLFVIGVVFTFFEILPPAIHFLQGYNDKQFFVLAQASSLYKFELLLMAGIGLAFQIPLVLLGLQRLGLVSSKSLTGNWRYAIVIIAVAVAALPGVDPVSMTFETIPLVGLFIVSIGLLKFVESRDRRHAAREDAEISSLSG
jgi:sec-independent protein translocase protein TatC